MLSKKIKTIIRYLLIASLLTPLAFPSFTLYPGTFGKTLFFQILISIAFILYLILLIKNEGKEKVELTPVFWLGFVYLSIRVISGFLGINPEKSFWGNQAWMMGNFTWIHFFIFFFLFTQFFKTKKDWIFLFKISIFVSFLVAITGILQRFGIVLFGWWEPAGRISGIIGSPIPFAGYIMFNIWIGYLVFYENLKESIRDFKANKNFDLLLQPAFWLLILLVNNIALFWSETLGVLYIYFMSIPLMLFLFGFLYSRKKYQKYLVVILITCVTILIIAWFNGGSEIARDILISRSTLDTRILNWQVAFQGWTESTKSFFIGYGPTNYDRVFDKYYNPEFLKYSFYETVGDRAHNIFLEVANASGLFGVIAYFSIFIGVFVVLFLASYRRELPKAYIIFILLAFLTYLGQSMIEFDTFSVVLLFFFLLAFVSFVSRKSFEDKLKEIKDIHIFVPFSFAVLLIIGTFVGTIQPIKASYYASVAKYNLAEKADRWAGFAQKSLNSKSVFHDEIRVLLANDIFQLNGRGIFHTTRDNIDALKLIHQKLGDSVLEHPGTYAYKHRYAQIESMMGEFVDKKYFNDAEETFDELYLENPNRQAVVLAWVQTKIFSGKQDEAIALLRKAVSQFPEYAEMRWYLGLALYESGDKEIGQLELEKSLKLGDYALQNPINIDFITALWEEKQEYWKIIGLYTQLTLDKKTNPMLATWLTRLAATYAKVGEYEKAIETVEEAVLVDPGLMEQAREFIRLIEEK